MKKGALLLPEGVKAFIDKNGINDHLLPEKYIKMGTQGNLDPKRNLPTQESKQIRGVADLIKSFLFVQQMRTFQIGTFRWIHIKIVCLHTYISCFPTILSTPITLERAFWVEQVIVSLKLGFGKLS